MSEPEKSDLEKFFEGIDFDEKSKPEVEIFTAQRQCGSLFPDPFEEDLEAKAKKDLQKIKKLIEENKKAKKPRNLQHNPDTDTFE